MSEITRTIPSTIHGDRVWLFVEPVSYSTKDGRIVRLAIWETQCAVCGAPFQVKTPFAVVDGAPSNSFTQVNCPRHKFTLAEASRLGRAPLERRRMVFEKLRQEKLDHDERDLWAALG